MPQLEPTSKFSPGRIAITANAASLLSGPDLTTALRRHLRGDWGDLGFSDRQQNERALLGGGRLFSAFRSQEGERFYVITEPDRSGTTLLLPEDY